MKRGGGQRLSMKRHACSSQRMRHRHLWRGGGGRGGIAAEESFVNGRGKGHLCEVKGGGGGGQRVWRVE